MSWMIFLIVVFLGLHFVVMLPVQIAIVLGAVLSVALWLLWKLKWVILGIIGLEEVFGGRGDSA
jgi:hypothetical protein